MADEVIDAKAEERGQQTEPKEVMDIDAKLAEIEKRFKAEISGLNRKNTELEKELDKERVAKMSETERLKHEKEAAEKRAADLEARQQEYQVEQMILAGLAGAKINPAVKQLMQRPETDAAINDWVKTFAGIVDAEAEIRVNERLKGKAPQASTQRGPVKALENFKDGQNASEAEFLAYLEKTLGE
jgi:type IV secretory pathway VirB4 component